MRTVLLLALLTLAGCEADVLAPAMDEGAERSGFVPVPIHPKLTILDEQIVPEQQTIARLDTGYEGNAGTWTFEYTWYGPDGPWYLLTWTSPYLQGISPNPLYGSFQRWGAILLMARPQATGSFWIRGTFDPAPTVGTVKENGGMGPGGSDMVKLSVVDE